MQDQGKNITSEAVAQEEPTPAAKAAARPFNRVDQALLSAIGLNLVAILAVVAHMMFAEGAWNSWNIGDIFGPLNYFRDDDNLLSLLFGSFLALCGVYGFYRFKAAEYIAFLGLTPLLVGGACLLNVTIDSLCFTNQATREIFHSAADRKFQITRVGIDAAGDNMRVVLKSGIVNLAATYAIKDFGIDDELLKKALLSSNVENLHRALRYVTLQVL